MKKGSNRRGDDGAAVPPSNSAPDLGQFVQFTPSCLGRRYWRLYGRPARAGQSGLELGVVALKGVHGAYGVLLQWPDGKTSLHHPDECYPAPAATAGGGVAVSVGG